MQDDDAMKRRLSALLGDYGMLLVLALVGLVFSVLTLQEQPATDAAAARRMVAAIRRAAPAAERVLIAVRGEPQQVRAALDRIAAAGGRIDAVAAGPRAGTWLVLTEMGALVPALGQPPIVVPDSVAWPAFLKADNLMNIASQIAVIAIMAIGMTMVIITGGIDLSVGSLAALAAVTAARLIRDVGGGVEATPPGMLLACVAAIAVCGLLGGLGGVILASQLKSGSPTYGGMYELYVIAAVVVGGTALAGGEGHILGALIGALIIAVIQNGMNLVGIESYTQKVVLGLVILAAVLVDRLRRTSERR
jgi:ABC-type xylose transport system permease subunit